mgnify:FL=1
MFELKLSVSQEEHSRKKQSENCRDYIDFLYLSRAQFDKHIRNDAYAYAVADVVGESHDCDGQERGDGDGGVEPINFSYAVHHEHAHVNESGGRRCGGDELGYGREEHSDEKADSDDNGSQSRSAALGNAGGGLHECRDGACAEHCAGGGGNRVGEHGFVHVGDVALFVKQVASCARPVKGAQSVEHIDEAEGEGGGDDNENKASHAVVCKIAAEIEAFGKHLSEGHCSEILKGLGNAQIEGIGQVVESEGMTDFSDDGKRVGGEVTEEIVPRRASDSCFRHNPTVGKSVPRVGFLIADSVVEIGNSETEQEIERRRAENSPKDCALDVLF